METALFANLIVNLRTGLVGRIDYTPPQPSSVSSTLTKMAHFQSGSTI